MVAAGAEGGASGRGVQGQAAGCQERPWYHVAPRSLQDWEKQHCKHLKEEKQRRTQLLH